MIALSILARVGIWILWQAKGFWSVETCRFFWETCSLLFIMLLFDQFLSHGFHTMSSYVNNLTYRPYFVILTNRNNFFMRTISNYSVPSQNSALLLVRPNRTSLYNSSKTRPLFCNYTPHTSLHNSSWLLLRFVTTHKLARAPWLWPLHKKFPSNLHHSCEQVVP